MARITLKEMIAFLRPKSLVNLLWWEYIPGVKIEVKWPKGNIAVGYNDPRWYDCGATWVEIESADPNDFYRPWLEENVGRQGWDWDWRLEANNVADNRLTIKVRRARAKYATMLSLMWN